MKIVKEVIVAIGLVVVVIVYVVMRAAKLSVRRALVVASFLVIVMIMTNAAVDFHRKHFGDLCVNLPAAKEGQILMSLKMCENSEGFVNYCPRCHDLSFSEYMELYIRRWKKILGN